MSGSTESLRRKIGSAGDLEGVVRSMKALAASSVGQYEKAVLSLNDYYRTVELGLGVCLRAGGAAPFAPGRAVPDRPVGAIIFGSDQGLVGRFNEVLVEFAARTLQALPGQIAKIWTIGERAHGLMAESALPPAELLAVPGSVNAITPLIGHILIEIEAARERGEVTEVRVFHNQPRVGALYEPVTRRLLPLDRLWQDEITALPWLTKQPPEIIGGMAQAVPAFVQGYLFVLLFQACAESLASENASRLAAMQRAEKNIAEILEELNRAFHRIRQEGIDEELFDVISGYEARSKSR